MLTIVIDVICVSTLVIFVFGYLFKKILQAMLPEQNEENGEVDMEVVHEDN